jgi:hypothetical protein
MAASRLAQSSSSRAASELSRGIACTSPRPPKPDGFAPVAAGQSAELGALMEDVLHPPIERICALTVNAFMKKKERDALAAALNTLLASPSLANWRQGSSLDVTEWVQPKSGKTPIIVVSVAHLGDDERALVRGVLLEEVLSWVRTCPARIASAPSWCSTRSTAFCRPTLPAPSRSRSSTSCAARRHRGVLLANPGHASKT